MAGGSITLRIKPEDAKMVQGFMQLQNRSKALEDQTRRLNAAAREGAQNAGQETGKWRGMVTGLSAGYAALKVGIDAAKGAMADLNAERERAAQAGKESYTGMGQLGQLASNAEDLRRMRDAARTSMREEGMTRADAGGLQFDLESAGKAPLRGFYASMHRLADSRKMVASVTRLQQAMGEQETGGDIQVMDKFIATSARTQATIEQLAASAATSGRKTRQVGTSDEELLAITGVGARSEDPQRVATQLRAFASSMIRSRRIPESGGLMAGAAALQQYGWSKRQTLQELGSEEAYAGYLLMTDQADAIRELEQELRVVDRRAAAATGMGPVLTGAVRAKRTIFGAARFAEKSSAGRSLADQERRADTELVNKAINEKIMELTAGEPAALHLLRARATDLGNLLGVNQAMVEPHVPRIIEEEAAKGLPGLKIDVRVSDERSPQATRNGGANGVE